MHFCFLLYPLIIRRSQNGYSNINTFFIQYGAIFIFLTVLLEYLNLPGFPAGVIKMDFLSYSISSAAGIFIWNFVLVGAGYWMGDAVLELFNMI